MAKTQSELLFEEYLVARGFTDFTFEKRFPGIRKRPDYTLPYRGKEILFEVKEFEPPENLVTDGAYTFDPFPRIREKIDAGRRKFREFKNHVCCLVLYNLGDPHVSIGAPLRIWGAMLGDPGVSTPIDAESGKALVELSRSVFTKGGKMIRYDKKDQPLEPQNTTLSAIIVLDHLKIGERRFHARYPNEREAEMDFEQRVLNCLRLVEDSYGTDCDCSLAELRVVVHENPYARTRLPRALFKGPYDERFGVRRNRSLQRLYAGKKLLEIEAEELAAGVQGSPVRHLFQS